MVVIAVLGIVVGVLLTGPRSGWGPDLTMVRLGRVLIAASILLAVLVVAASPIASEAGVASTGPSPGSSAFVPGRLPAAFLN